MKTTLALDLQHRSHGALEFLRWLSDGRDLNLQVHAVHVVPEQALSKQGPFVSSTTPDLIHAARLKLEAGLEENRDHGWVGSPSVCTGASVETVVERECKANGSELLVIGRAAAKEDRPIVRLGRVARRLLRRLNVPTAVVPRDLKARDIGPGPVLVALGCSEHDVAATDWAQQFAASIGRRVVFVHVAAPPEAWAYGYVESGADSSVGEWLLQEARKSATQWLEAQDCKDHELVVEQGMTSPSVNTVAEQLNACVIVSGSRKLTTVERVFSTSIGSELAASSTRPVIIVPGTA